MHAFFKIYNTCILNTVFNKFEIKDSMFFTKHDPKLKNRLSFGEYILHVIYWLKDRWHH